MGTKTYRPSRDDRVPDNAEVLDERISQIVKYRLIPQMAVRNRIAVQGQAAHFYLFRKLTVGRRCSCMQLSTSPKQHCLSCFQTAIVGGYEKYGTDLSVFDVTHPNTRAVNCFPDYKGANLLPVKWKLIPGSTYGYIETKVPLPTNLGLIDELFYDEELTAGGDILYWIKAPGDADWVEVTEKEVGRRLGNPYIYWRVELRRESLAAAGPAFGLIYLRYQILKDMIVRCDIPKTKRQRMSEDLGTFDEWQRQAFWLPDKVRRINPGDFLVSPDDKTRWKIYEAEETAPVEQLIGWDLTTRLIQAYEPTSRVPIGNLSTHFSQQEILTHDPNYKYKPASVVPK